MKIDNLFFLLFLISFLVMIIIILFVVNQHNDDDVIIPRTPIKHISDCQYTQFHKLKLQNISNKCLHISGNKDLSIVGFSENYKIELFKYSFSDKSYKKSEILKLSPKYIPILFDLNDMYLVYLSENRNKICIFEKTDNLYFEGKKTEVLIPNDKTSNRILFENSNQNSIIFTTTDQLLYQLFFNGEDWIYSSLNENSFDTQYVYTDIFTTMNDKIFRLLFQKSGNGFMIVEYNKDEHGRYMKSHDSILDSPHNISQDQTHAIKIGMSSDLRTIVVTDPFYTPFNENETHKGRVISYNRTTVTSPFSERTHTTDPSGVTLSHFGLNVCVVDSDHVFISGSNMSKDHSPKIYVYRLASDGSLIYEDKFILNDVDHVDSISDILVSNHNTIDHTVRVMWTHNDQIKDNSVVHFTDSSCT